MNYTHLNVVAEDDLNAQKELIVIPNAHKAFKKIKRQNGIEIGLFDIELQLENAVNMIKKNTYIYTRFRPVSTSVNLKYMKIGNSSGILKVLL